MTRHIPIFVLYAAAFVPVFLLAGCAAGSGGLGGGGVVIDPPRKLLEAVIVGRVLHGGEPVAGATVIAKGLDTETITDENGEFRLEIKTMTSIGVAKKRVQVEVSAEGLRTRTKGVYVEQHRQSSVTIELLPKYQ